MIIGVRIAQFAEGSFPSPPLLFPPQAGGIKGGVRGRTGWGVSMPNKMNLIRAHKLRKNLTDAERKL